MVMVAVVIFAHQFKASSAIAKVKPLDDPHFFQEVHGTIDGGEVALPVALSHLSQYFTIGERVGMFAQDFQDRRPRAGNFAGLTAQTFFESGQILSFS